MSLTIENLARKTTLFPIFVDPKIQSLAIHQLLASPRLGAFPNKLELSAASAVTTNSETISPDGNSPLPRLAESGKDEVIWGIFEILRQSKPPSLYALFNSYSVQSSSSQSLLESGCDKAPRWHVRSSKWSMCSPSDSPLAEEGGQRGSSRRKLSMVKSY
jgi:hypothetical protein